MTETVTRTTRTGSHLIAAALRQELARDERVVIFGEDVGRLGGVFGATRRLQREFGHARVFDTPVSETAFVGMGVGAAQAGLRPVVELMFVDFIGVCFDQVLNQMAKNHYMSGGVVQVPLVLRTAVGCIGSAAQHSQVLSATFAHIPGLRVVFPATHRDLAQMLVAAVRSADPVIFLEHKWLLKSRVGTLPLSEYVDETAQIEPADLSSLKRRRDGGDITIAASGWMVQHAITASDQLAALGISAGVVDLRVLQPLDTQGLIHESAAAPTMLVVDEDYASCGLSSEVICAVAEALGPSAPLMARHAPTVPVPAAKTLEDDVVPSVVSIRDAAQRLVDRTALSSM